MIHSPRAAEEDIASAAMLLRDGDPIASVYRVLDDVAARHGCTDAWIVLHPAKRTTQVFRLGASPVAPADIHQLMGRPTGLYTEPPVDAATGAAVGALCEAAFVAQVAAVEAVVDPTTGLAGRRAIESSLARAAACAARHRWCTTAVLVTLAAGGHDDDRWSALCDAIRAALRSGDEAGVAGPGTVLALLGNAGADAVRPFIARVRATLSASGWDDVDLLAATATTPQETVDPAEMAQLAAERLEELGAGRASQTSPVALELELRLLPGVAAVGTVDDGGAPGLIVVALGSTADRRAAVEAAASRLHPGIGVELLETDAMGGPANGVTVAAAHAAPDTHAGVNGHATGPRAAAPSQASQASQASHPLSNAATTAFPPTAAEPAPADTTDTLGSSAGDGEQAPLRSATAPGGGTGPAGAAPRVTLLSSSFDADRGVSEVALSQGTARGAGRAPAGPLSGGAQATLVALGALGRDVPFYLVSAERIRTMPGEPVVVVLAPRRAGEAAPSGSGERIGVAAGAHDVEAASRATLAALNRFLAEASVA